MRKIYSLLLLGGLLLLGAQSAWADWYLLGANTGTWDVNTTKNPKFRPTGNSDELYFGLYFSAGNNYFALSNGSSRYQAAASDNRTLTVGGSAITNTSANGDDDKSFYVNIATDGFYNIIINVSNSSKPSVKIASSSSGTIYFYNTLGWTNVYVNLYGGSYWSDTKGSGNKDIPVKNQAMTNLGNGYFKYDYTGIGSYVSFTNASQDGYGDFWRCNVSYRGDFNYNTPVYVPKNYCTASLNETGYYNDGVWIGYDATSFSRTITSGSFGTICSPVDATITGGVLYTVAGRNDGKTILYLVAETSDAATTLTAGIPYFYKATADAQSFSLTASAIATTPSTAKTGVYGTYAETAITKDAGYCVLSSNNLLNVTTDGVKVKANRTYINKDNLSVYAPESAPGRPIIAMPFEGNEATDIYTVEASETAIKFIQNGKLYILRDGVTYDATGRVVK